MAVAARSVVYLSGFLIVFLLTSCNLKFEDVPPDNSMPTVSATGADVVVCRVGDQMQVYKEEYTLFDDREVNITHAMRGGGSNTVRVINIDAERNDDHNRVDLYVIVDKPETNKPYSLGRNIFFSSKYSINGTEYLTDTSVSFVLFTRFDDSVGAGEFSMTAVHMYNHADTIRIIGWFDIPFEK